MCRTVRNHGVCPAHPRSIEGQDHAAILILIRRRHGGLTRERIKGRKSWPIQAGRRGRKEEEEEKEERKE